MNLPEYEWVRFKKTPLKMVIGQVRFTIIPRFHQEGFTGDFQEAVYPDYPRVSREQTVTYQLSPTGARASPGAIVWRLSPPDNLWSVFVDASVTALEAG